MAASDLYPKLTSINFTVRNVSPQRKRLTVFNTPIEYLQTYDLLTIEGIGEDDIRSSLVKGELANKIRVGALKIVSSSINLLQFDAEQKAFIDSANSDLGQPLPGTDPVTQCGPQNGGGGGGYIDVTYSQLTTLIAANNLVKGAYYQITDFRTCYVRPNYDYNKNPIFTGNYSTSEIHPIVVLAISENKLAVDAYQPDYPNDKIKYDVNFSSTPGASSGPAYGKITERIDEFNNRTDYDHRSILFRRYRINYYSNLQPQEGTIQLLSDGTINGTDTNFTSLNIGDVIAIPQSNEKFYKIASIDSNTLMTVTGISISNTIPNVQFFIANTGSYDSYYQSNAHLDSDFNLYTTFGDAIENEAAFNNYIGNHTNEHYIWNTGDFDLANNVFKSGEYYNNTIGNSSYNNTFNDDCTNNTIGNYFYNNITDDDFDSNIIGDNFNNNLITANFRYNQIGSYFEQNTIINSNFSNNNIGNDFSSNLLDSYNSFYFENNFIENSFTNNKIYENFYTNSIGYNFNNNNFYNYFRENKVKNSFNQNTIGESSDLNNGQFYKNDIGEEVKGNLFLQNFHNNILGNNFAENETGDNFSNNLIGNNFTVNTVGSYFSFNLIGNNFSSNNVGAYFAYNQIQHNFVSNSIDNNFGFGFGDARGNIIGSNFINNAIREYFYNNRVADNFSENNIGEYFQLNNIKTEYLNNTNFEENHGNIIQFSTNIGLSIPGTNGLYSNVNATYLGEGSGYDAQFTVFVADSVVTSVTISFSGYAYSSGDVLKISASNFGGVEGSDILITVSEVTELPSVYGNYNCEIFKNSDGIFRLSYYDENDVLTIKDINL